MGLAMTRTLSSEQMAVVKAASASLRPAARDRFLLDLASALARYPHQPSDAELHICIRQLLGITPLCHFAQKDIAS
jgi:hypothetical protein